MQPRLEPDGVASIFAALGDPTRLALLGMLSGGRERSITVLGEEARRSAGIAVSRQALTKHLAVLERSGLVAQRRIGRESRFRAKPETLDDARAFLDRVSVQWDGALGRLKAFVEERDG